MPRGVGFFDYAIPETLAQDIRVGALVRIPFRAKKIDGIVCAIEKKQRSSFTLKNILSLHTAHALLPSYWSTFLTAIEADMGVPPPTALRSFLAIGKRESSLSFHQKFPQLGKRYDALRIGKNSLPAIQSVLGGSTSKLFIWHKNEERVVAYLKFIESTLRKGSALILFPQWSEVEAFLEYLPKKYAHIVHPVHSVLSSAQRRSIWQQIAERKKQIIVGTRFALFTPLQDLAGIILDHEHAYGWKEEQSPRYDTRRYVEMLQRITNIPVLFSSPSPTIERRYDLQKTTAETPALTESNTVIADLRDSFTTGHPYITETLREAIENCARNDRIILLHNRTGYGSSLGCADCGVVIMCTNCQLPFTHHKDINGKDILQCHHCLKNVTVPLVCASCKGSRLVVRGKGNERIAEEVHKLFPDYTNIAVHTYPMLPPLLWEKKETPITLLAFIDALSPLSIPDFKTLDDLFLLLVIARTVAVAHGATMVLQTFSPDHPLFDTAGFLQRELEERRKMRYPPFTRLIKLIVKDTDAVKAQQHCEALTPLLLGEGGVRSLSAPFPSHPPRRGSYYYWYRLLRVPHGQSLTPIIKKIPSDILLDIDPETLL